MASRQDSNTEAANKKPATPGAALKRSAVLIYKFLKPKMSRSDSEHKSYLHGADPTYGKGSPPCGERNAGNKETINTNSVGGRKLRETEERFLQQKPKTPLPEPLPDTLASRTIPSGQVNYTKYLKESLENIYDDLVATMNTAPSASIPLSRIVTSPAPPAYLCSRP